MEAEALRHFQSLLKIDTTNPPGREIYAIQYLSEILNGVGIPPFIQETAPERGNLVARLKGNGDGKPLLISSHVDVVPAESSQWEYDPFSAEVHNGYIYGRGAVDMKNFTAFCLAVMVQAKQEKWPLKRDLIMSAVSDEERGGNFGMLRLVQDHPEKIQAEYALGETGGYTAYIQGHPFYPIQVGEKGVFWVLARLKGQPGHGSFPTSHNVHWTVADFLKKLHLGALPYHRTKSFDAFSSAVSARLGGFKGVPFKLINSPLGPYLLKRKVLHDHSHKAALLLAMITNTVNPTGIQSGKAHNVVPSIAELKLDCRIIPGLSHELVIDEIRGVTGYNLDYEIIGRSYGHETPMNTPLFDLIKKKIGEYEPQATPLPVLTTGYTDAGHLQKLGIQCYGFTPLKLAPQDDFSLLYHGHNERVPVEGFLWGYRIFSDLIKEFCCS